MSTMPAFTRLLSICGAVIVALSLGWWWLTYRDVVGYNYLSLPDAALCLVSNSDICQLAKSLCRDSHPLAIFAYWSASLWIGVAALCASLATGATGDA
ncbi:hypothetical protein [Labrys neptuniae]